MHSRFTIFRNRFFFIIGDQDDDEFTPSSSRGTKRRNTSSSSGNSESRYLSILERLADQSKLPYAEFGKGLLFYFIRLEQFIIL
jgi:hypothetical protein